MNIEVKVNFIDVDLKGIIYIFYGMVEYMECYDKLVYVFLKYGFDVICYNYWGYGINIDELIRGYYDDMKWVIGDVFEVV